MTKFRLLVEQALWEESAREQLLTIYPTYLEVDRQIPHWKDQNLELSTELQKLGITVPPVSGKEVSKFSRIFTAVSQSLEINRAKQVLKEANQWKPTLLEILLNEK